VVNTATFNIIACEILNGDSSEIRASVVLPELDIAVVEQALQRSQTTDDGEVNR
jgi:hypothetical protein